MCAEVDHCLIELVELLGRDRIERLVSATHVRNCELALTFRLRDLVFIPTQPYFGAVGRLRILSDMQRIPSLLDSGSKHGIRLKELPTHGKPNGCQKRRMISDDKKPSKQKLFASVFLNSFFDSSEGCVEVL
jgi:hypothetical protein